VFFVVHEPDNNTIVRKGAGYVCPGSFFFPQGTRLFETERVPSGPIKWGVWVIYISKGIQTAPVRITNHLRRDRQLEVKIGWVMGVEELSPV